MNTQTNKPQLIKCERCGMKTFDTMLEWHNSRCKGNEYPKFEEFAERYTQKKIKVHATDVTYDYVALVIEKDNVDAFEQILNKDGKGSEWYKTSSTYQVHIVHFLMLKDNDKLDVKISKEVQKVIDDYNRPPWHVAIGERTFVLTPHKNTPTNVLFNIPGTRYSQQKYLVPMSEGWRLAQVLSEVQGVVYEDDALKEIESQVRKRQEIEGVHSLKYAPAYDITFVNGDKLMQFQTVGVKMADLADGNVIISDKPGLGKTHQAIGYAFFKQFARNVVVCPANIKLKWKRTIEALTGETVTMLSGITPSNGDIKELLINKPKWVMINYDILARSVEIKKEQEEDGRKIVEKKEVFLWVDVLNLYKPDIVIVDEGHYIKNVESKRSKAVIKLEAPRFTFLTATPAINRPSEVFPMFHKVAPSLFPAHQTFVNQYTYDGKKARNVKELQEAMRTFYIRRNREDVFDDIPPLNRIREFVELNEKAKSTYIRVMSGVYEAADEYDTTKGGGISQLSHILALITKAKKVCEIGTIERTAELATELYDSNDEGENKKVIIFSQFKAVAYAIYRRLQDDGAICTVKQSHRGWDTYSSAERDAIVNRFQSDSRVKYLVTTEKAIREGLDATAAHYVIFNGIFWTPAAHEQAEGRAYFRLNDMHGVDSYYMIADLGEGAQPSIESWNMDLLAFKDGIISEVMNYDGDNALDSNSSVLMQIIDKLKTSSWRPPKKQQKLSA